MHVAEAGLIHALTPDARRCYDRKEAASYVGVSPNSFDKLVRRASCLSRHGCSAARSGIAGPLIASLTA